MVVLVFPGIFAGQVKPHGSGQLTRPDPTRPPKMFRYVDLIRPDPFGPEPTCEILKTADPTRPDPTRPVIFLNLLTRPDPTRNISKLLARPDPPPSPSD